MTSKIDSLIQLEKQLAEISRKIANERGAALDEIIETVNAQANEVGITVDELIDALRKSKKTAKKATRPPAQAKYKNPLNPAETWSGRGKNPKWYTEAIKDGHTPESMAV
jgi:DNA-binding protein H-NS